MINSIQDLGDHLRQEKSAPSSLAARKRIGPYWMGFESRWSARLL